MPSHLPQQKIAEEDARRTEEAKQAHNKAARDAQYTPITEADGEPIAIARREIEPLLSGGNKRLYRDLVAKGTRERRGDWYLGDSYGRELVAALNNAHASGKEEEAAAYKAVIATLERADAINLERSRGGKELPKITNLAPFGKLASAERFNPHTDIVGKNPLTVAAAEVGAHLTTHQAELMRPLLERAIAKKGADTYVSNEVGRELLQSSPEGIDATIARRAALAILSRADTIMVAQSANKTELPKITGLQQFDHLASTERFQSTPTAQTPTAVARAPITTAKADTRIARGDTLTAIAKREDMKKAREAAKVALGEGASEVDALLAVAAIIAKENKIDDIHRIKAGDKINLAGITDDTVKQGIAAIKAAGRVDASGHVAFGRDYKQGEQTLAIFAPQTPTDATKVAAKGASKGA